MTMRRVAAALFVTILVAVQVVPGHCPMSGGDAGSHAPDAPVAAHVGHAAGHASTEAGGGDAPRAPSHGTVPPAGPMGSAGCGALMGCGLAALAPLPGAVRAALPVSESSELRPTVPVSAAAAPVELPPPRA